MKFLLFIQTFYYFDIKFIDYICIIHIVSIHSYVFTIRNVFSKRPMKTFRITTTLIFISLEKKIYLVSVLYFYIYSHGDKILHHIPIKNK